MDGKSVSVSSEADIIHDCGYCLSRIGPWVRLERSEA